MKECDPGRLRQVIGSALFPPSLHPGHLCRMWLPDCGDQGKEQHPEQEHTNHGADDQKPLPHIFGQGGPARGRRQWNGGGFGHGGHCLGAGHRFWKRWRRRRGHGLERFHAATAQGFAGRIVAGGAVRGSVDPGTAAVVALTISRGRDDLPRYRCRARRDCGKHDQTTSEAGGPAFQGGAAFGAVGGIRLGHDCQG